MQDTLTMTPTVRRDLVISEQQQDSGNLMYVIKDPITGRYFRMLKDDYDLLTILDGSASLEHAVCLMRQKHGMDVELETVKKFAIKLKAAGLLEEERPVHGQAPFFQGSGVFFFQRILWVRLRVFNPDKIFSSMVPSLRFFFTPFFVVAASAVICSGVYLVLRNLHRLGADMQASFGFHLAAAFWIAGLLIAILHECAHGLTCKYFGGEVRELGVLLIYFNLALYCNVSDAWLFREPRKRFWVMFSGAFFEAFLWALAAVIWWFSVPQSWIHRYALIVIAISGVKNLLNLLPLIKLDGYYLLSDMLNVPNLRTRSLQFYKQLILKMVTGSSVKNVPFRDKMFYLTYGAMAVPFSIWLIGYMYMHLSLFLIAKYGNVGKIVTAVLLTLIFGDLVLTILKRVYVRLRGTDSSELETAGVGHGS